MTVLTGALSVSEILPNSGTRKCGLRGAGLEVLFVSKKTLEEPQAPRAILNYPLRHLWRKGRDSCLPLAVLGTGPRALVHTRQVL